MTPTKRGTPVPKEAAAPVGHVFGRRTPAGRSVPVGWSRLSGTHVVGTSLVDAHRLGEAC